MTLSLMEPYRNTGLDTTTDNFFTSLCLARKLLRSNITMVGTMRAHPREIPSEIAQMAKSAPFYSSKFVFTPAEESIVLLSSKAKKNKVVYIISSGHNLTTVDYGEKETSRYLILQCY